MRITNDIGSITTTIDIDDGANGVFIIVSSWRSIAVNAFSIFTRNHVDVYRRAAIHRSARTVSTTEDTAQVITREFTDSRTGDDVQHRIGIRQAFSRFVFIRHFIIFRFGSGYENRGFFRSSILIAIYRIGCFFTTQIEFVNDQRVTARLLDGECDGTFDRTGGIITTIDTFEVSAGYNQIYAAFHISSSCAAIDIVHVVDTTQNQGHCTILLSLVTGSVYFLDVANVATVVCGSRISANIRHRYRGSATHISFGIRTSEDIYDMSADQLGYSLSRTIVLRIVMIINTYIGTRITLTSTVTTAKYVVDDIIS